MIKLLEPKLFLKVRKEDLSLINGLIPECEKEFREIMEKETQNTNDDIKYETELKVIEGAYLTVEEGGECGGIILYSENRKIVCGNTLQNRLELCFEELLPEIRAILFPTQGRK